MLYAERYVLLEYKRTRYKTVSNVYSYIPYNLNQYITNL